MQILDASQIQRRVSMEALVEALRTAFQRRYFVPPRQVVNVPGGTSDRLFVSMPAFSAEEGGCVKMVTLFPENRDAGLPTIQASILVFSSRGEAVALLDGTSVTHLRTGAASALASSYLSRITSSHLVIFGTGALVPAMAAGHCAVRPIKRITVCGRQLDRSHDAAARIRAVVPADVDITPSDTPARAVESADIVTCATSSTHPVLNGSWLRPGTLVDLVGSFSPNTREADDRVMTQARIFVDTYDGALAEAGDVIQPLARGVIERDRIEGSLAELASGAAVGRRDDDEIIVFKSVGTAIEDLAASLLVVKSLNL